MTQKFLNCPMAYECPKNWFELSPTKNAGVKYCNTCKQEVFLCLEEVELNERIAVGVCVAYFVQPDRQTSFTLAKETAQINKRHTKLKPQMTLGIPSGSKRFLPKN